MGCVSKSWLARAVRLAQPGNTDAASDAGAGAGSLWAELSLDLAAPDTAPTLDWLTASEERARLPKRVALTLARDSTSEPWELGAALGALCRAPSLAALSLRLAGVAKGMTLGVLGSLLDLEQLELRLSWQTAQHLAEQEWAQLVS